MKYFDFNKSHQENSKLDSKPAYSNFLRVDQSAFFAKKPPSKMLKPNYRFRFYLIIFFILASSFLYVRYQVLYQKNSVFSDLYEIITNHFSKSKQVTPYSQKKTQSKKTPIEKKIIKEKPLLTNKRENQLILYYFPKMDDRKNRIQFIAVKDKAKINFKQESAYFKIIKNLITYRSIKEGLLDSFNKKIILRKAWIENRVLILDFNKAFEINRYGDKGLHLQIQQLLWTLLTIPSSKKSFDTISFLIEGRRKRNIGGHGVPLKPFYSKKDLKKYIYFRKKNA